MKNDNVNLGTLSCSSCNTETGHLLYLRGLIGPTSAQVLSDNETCINYINSTMLTIQSNESFFWEITVNGVPQV